MKILAQTRDYAVIDKPIGMLSQPDREGGGEDAISALKRQIGGEIYPIHRLDRGTGGVMVFARTKRAAALLSAAAADSTRMRKEYLAVVHGVCEEEGEMIDLLLHRSVGNKSFVVDRMRSGVKEARLTYRRLGTLTAPEPLSLVQVALKTGRTHQIRVQFAHRGHPLHGDGKYGARSSGIPALFCCSLTFPDPASGAELRFTTLPSGSLWERFSLPLL